MALSPALSLARDCTLFVLRLRIKQLGELAPIGKPLSAQGSGSATRWVIAVIAEAGIGEAGLVQPELGRDEFELMGGSGEEPGIERRPRARPRLWA
jgi:hypothetical protein